MRIEKYSGDRSTLIPLFALADDSRTQICSYLNLGEVFVLQDAGSIQAHVQIVETADTGVFELKSLAVGEQLRGEGFGRGLIAVATAYCRNRGGHRLIVGTAAADIGNLRFYQQNRFRLCRIVHDVFTPASGYAKGILVDRIPLRDQVFLELNL